MGQKNYWFEVYTCDQDGDTRTIETVDTLKEAYEYLNKHGNHYQDMGKDVYIDKWFLDQDGTPRQVEGFLIEAREYLC